MTILRVVGHVLLHVPESCCRAKLSNFFNQLSYFDRINHPDKYFLDLLNNAIVKVNLNVYSVMGPNGFRILRWELSQSAELRDN